MLEPLIEYSHHSIARYFKGILLLIDQKTSDGLKLLKQFHANPKNFPPENLRNEVFYNQLSMAKDLTQNLIMNLQKQDNIATILSEHIKCLPPSMLSSHKNEVNELNRLFREFLASRIKAIKEP